MRSLIVRFAFLSLPLAAAAALLACEDSSSSGGGKFTPEAGTPFTTPDASSGTDSSPPAPPKLAETTTTLDLTPLSPKVGDELSIKVTVSGKTPTGTVQLKDGATNLGAPIVLAAAAGAGPATATFKTKTLTLGAHAISAVYAGDDDDAPSTSTVTPIDLKYGTTNPFATGVNDARVALADLAVDPHWTIKNGAGKAFTAYVQTDAKGFVGFWLAPSTTSKFLSPFMDTDDTAVEGPFTYTTTFSLRTGVDLSGTSLSVSYANDNAMDSISLNGTAVPGVSAGGYGSFTILPITGPFLVGTNTIAFVSSNSGGPTGFRAELTLTAN